MEENWREAARYLGLSFISEYVEEDCVPGDVLENERSTLEERFKRARPYLLAVVNQQRGLAESDVARYLLNLRLKVVSTLVVHQRVTLPPGKLVVDDEAKIYVEKTSRQAHRFQWTLATKWCCVCPRRI